MKVGVLDDAGTGDLQFPAWRIGPAARGWQLRLERLAKFSAEQFLARHQVLLRSRIQLATQRTQVTLDFGTAQQFLFVIGEAALQFRFLFAQRPLVDIERLQLHRQRHVGRVIGLYVPVIGQAHARRESGAQLAQEYLDALKTVMRICNLTFPTREQLRELGAETAPDVDLRL